MYQVVCLFSVPTSCAFGADLEDASNFKRGAHFHSPGVPDCDDVSIGLLAQEAPTGSRRPHETT
eukprot:2867124-Pyramimonas_sp.AAC.1